MEIEKEIDDKIIKYLYESKIKYTDLSLFIEDSKYNFAEFYEILKDLVKEDIIEPKNEKGFYSLILTKKGKLAVNTELTFKLTEKGQSRLRLRNELNSLEEQSTTTYKEIARTTKSSNGILQNIFWIVLIIGGIISIHKFIEEQFELNIIKWIINKF